MDNLSPEQKQYFLKFCGITELINLADTSMEWRNLVTDQLFLDDICNRRFGLVFDELPELTAYEKLLINTQQIAFQANNSNFFGVHPSLAKIYAMELRASWFPYLFNGSDVKISQNIVMRDFKYPWMYDQSIGGSPFYHETKKLSARIHAAFPDLFETLIDSTRHLFNNEIKFEYITGNYPRDIQAIAAAEENVGHFGLNDRQPRIIQMVRPSGQVLFFFIYENDQSWRVAYHNPIYVPDGHISSGFIPWKATLQEIRTSTIGEAILYFCELETDFLDNSTYCPSMGPLETTQLGIHMVQLELVNVLDAVIQTNASTLVDVALVSLVNSEPDQKHRDLLIQKLIKSIDSLYPCDSRVYGHSDKGNRPSKKLSIAFGRALRRFVNRAFLPEVKDIHENPLTRQLVHAWSFQGKGRKRRICYDTSAPSGFDFKRRCFMKSAVSRLMCCHQGLVDLWPAITLKKAIDQAPKLAKKLNSDMVELISFDAVLDGMME